jgi:FkbM family methyltransferase
MITYLIDLYRIFAFPALRKISHLSEIPVVYSVGARDGLASSKLQYLQRHDAIRSLGFEPDAEEVSKLEKSRCLSRVMPYAVGRSTGAAILYLTKMRGASSLYPPDLSVLKDLTPLAQLFEVEKEVKVELKRLDDLIDKENLPQPHLLHIDAQASELDIIEGLGQYLEDVSVITLEAQTYPVYCGQKLFHEIVEYLWKQGFVCCQIDEPNDSPVFSPFFVEANVSFVNLRKLRSGCMRTKLLMELVRLGEHSNSRWKTAVSKILHYFRLS